MQRINAPSYPPSSPHPVLNLGFRVFFIGAAIFSVAVMGLWLAVLQGWLHFRLDKISIFTWHGHEMVFGYALAVVAGFLLTAVKTWTNQPMPYGLKLLGVFLPWALARLGWLLVPSVPSTLLLIVTLLLDILWWSLVCLAVFTPIIRVRQRRQMGILAKLALLWCTMMIFSVGVWQGEAAWQQLGIYLAFYLIIAVVLTIGRRVMPMFIANGINHHLPKDAAKAELTNSAWADRLSLFGFLGFMLADLCHEPKLAAAFALMTALANGYRLRGWYHHGMWARPLVWSLYVAFMGMTLSFIMFALLPWLDIAHSLAVHTLALSGIGIMTLSMMSRVSLGHTGNLVHKPSKWVGVMMLSLLAATVVRGVLPMLLTDSYQQLLLISQLLWLAGFMMFLWVYLPILTKPRKDGLFG